MCRSATGSAPVHTRPLAFHIIIYMCLTTTENPATEKACRARDAVRKEKQQTMQKHLCHLTHNKRTLSARESVLKSIQASERVYACQDAQSTRARSRKQKKTPASRSFLLFYFFFFFAAAFFFGAAFFAAFFFVAILLL